MNRQAELNNSYPLQLERKIRKYGLIIQTSLQNSMAYVSNFFFDSFFYAFVVFILLQLWCTIYSHGDRIAGYSLQQMVWYSVIAEMMTLSGSNIFSDLNNDIKDGNIAYALNKPYFYIWYQLANGMGLIMIKLAVTAVIGVILGMIYIGPLNGFAIIHLPFIALTVAGGLLTNFLALTCLGLTAFWLEENTAFFWIYQKLIFMLGMFLPIDFFPEWLQKIARVLPFSYVTYGPAKLVVAFSRPMFYQVFGMQLIYISVFLLSAIMIYQSGVKKLNVNGG